MSASYVWRVGWYVHGKSGGKQYKAFTNKQQALIFMSKLKSNSNNYCIEIEKWFG